MRETVEQFLERGGKIQQCKPGKYERANIYRKDKQLNALRQLKKQHTDPKIVQEIEQAIDSRIQVLKVTF